MEMANTMVTVLSQIKKGHATTLYGWVVIRIGDRFIVGESPSIRETGMTIEEAAAKFYAKGK